MDLQNRLWEVAHATFHRIPDAQRQVRAPLAGQYASGKRLYRDIKSYLIKASDQRILQESLTVIHQNLLFTGPHADGYFDIAVGTVRNFNRVKSFPHFTRRDGAWFDFQLQIREEDNRADIIAYDFELRLPAGGSFNFVRFDLNPPGASPENDGLRSHLHLNSDDDGMAIPAAVMSPFEILDLFLYGLHRSGRVRRSPAKEV